MSGITFIEEPVNELKIFAEYMLAFVEFQVKKDGFSLCDFHFHY